MILRMTTRVKESMIPPGGWHYVQPTNTGGSMRIEAGSLSDLIDRVIIERVNMDLDVSTIIRDIEEYICTLGGKYQCRPDRGKRRPAGAALKTRQIEALITRISAWVDGIHSVSDRRMVSNQEANRRAAICRGCNQSIRWHISCDSCNDKIERFLFCLRNGRSTEYDRKLDRKGCRAIGICHRTAVHLDLEAMDAVPDASKAPTGCWIKSLKQQSTTTPNGD